VEHEEGKREAEQAETHCVHVVPLGLAVDEPPEDP
jgi:hypothetical protein